MKIDTSKIAGYAEMSAEDKLKALEELDFDIDETETVKKLKTALSERNSQIAKQKELEKSRMSESERLEAERTEQLKSLEEELKTLKREKTVADYTAKFVAMGYSEESAKKSAEASADGNITEVLSLQKTFLENYAKELDAEKLRNMGKPNTSKGGEHEITKEEFDKMSYAERLALHDKNPELYKKLL